MKHNLFFVIVTALIALSAANTVEAQSRTAKSGSYESLSDTDRHIVRAIYESQLGSRRDLAGHPLLSKDRITAMRRGGRWEDVYGRLVQQGAVSASTLQEAMASYGRDTLPLSRSLIISTAGGGQIVVPRRTARPPSAPPPPNPALANIIPTKPVRRAHVSVVELPVLTASGEESDSGTSLDPVSDGALMPGIAASAAQSR